ncbi:MAG: DUF5684 domain-containing protein [Gemmataceae bacterium]|nr:DUF5684 domain-containing protein [Gemmataceae bacterium]MDW8243938.1 DUF5684 domain-containing protein [Thermogemmata sp.]
MTDSTMVADRLVASVSGIDTLTAPWAAAHTQWLLPYVLGWVVITIPAIVAGWLGVFQKAGQSRWAALLPGYNIYVLVVRVAGLSPVWCLFLLLPPVNLIAAIVVNVEVARRFGRTEAFGVGMAVFGFILYPWLGFGSAEYQRLPIGRISLTAPTRRPSSR